MAIKPLGGRILVKSLESEEKTPGGIILPDTAKEKPQRAEVVAVGKGKLLEDGTIKPPEVKAGDKVLHGKYSGKEVTHDGVEYLILDEDEILAIIK
jgi:chaperonin GroES